jgi:hypothetical protein
MKKKFRDIVVEGKQYGWSVGHKNCDGDGNCKLTIWHDKKIIYNGVIQEDIQVTPLYIKDFINSLGL